MELIWGLLVLAIMVGARQKFHGGQKAGAQDVSAIITTDGDLEWADVQDSDEEAMWRTTETPGVDLDIGQLEHAGPRQ